jgi:hypothetical protein
LGLAIIVVVVIAGCSLVSPYRNDGWGAGGRTEPAPVGPSIRPDWEQVKERAAGIIEDALSSATDLGPLNIVEVNETLPFGTESFQWIPAGRPTKLPPGGHGARIYQVEVFSKPAPTGQAVTIVTFEDEFGPTFRFDLPSEASDRLFEVLTPKV